MMWLRGVVAFLVLALGHGDHQPPPQLLISPERMEEELLRSPTALSKLINFTLVGDQWADGLGVMRGLTNRWLQEAIRGTDGVLGWLKVVGPHLSASDVTRVTDSMLSLRLGWFPTLDVQVSEPVFISAPWWATAHNVTAEPTFANLTIDASVPRVSLSGDLVGKQAPGAPVASPH